jgi:predicted ATP-grasp superfamily ATP-dependent carboligase
MVEAIRDKMGEVTKVVVSEDVVVGVRMDEVDMVDMSHIPVITQLMNGKASLPLSIPV